MSSYTVILFYWHVSYTKFTEKWKKYNLQSSLTALIRITSIVLIQSVAYSLMFLAENYECGRKRKKEMQKKGPNTRTRGRKWLALFRILHPVTGAFFRLPSATLTNLLETGMRDPESEDCDTNTTKPGADKQLNNIFLTSCSGTNDDTRDFRDQRAMEIIAIIG